MQKEYVLEMDNIVKSFAANRVLDGVTIRIKPGEVRALMGENGAGKSTLMKILGGIYSADEGKIAIGGEPVEIKSVDDAGDQQCSKYEYCRKLFPGTRAKNEAGHGGL